MVPEKMVDLHEGDLEVKIPTMDQPLIEDVSDREGETFEDAPDTNLRLHSGEASPARSPRDLIHGQSLSPLGAPVFTEARTKEVAETRQKHSSGLDGTADSEPRINEAEPISFETLDDINLVDTGSDDESGRSQSSTVRSSQSSRLAVPSPKQLPNIITGAPSVKSFRRPSMPWSTASPVHSTTLNPNPNAPAPRKLSSPFAWLSRNSGGQHKEVFSPPLPPHSGPFMHDDRRDTTVSLTAVGSNPELMLSKFADGSDSESTMDGPPYRPGRNSLRDRFKMLRIREEAGIASFGEDQEMSPGSTIASLIGRGTGLGLGIGSPTSVVDDREGMFNGDSARSPSTAGSSPILPSTINTSLAPGTISGLSAGPSAMQDPSAPVDWDLWQAVVYEGPAAVARTSAEELNRAITSGIPSAIRGVVWQVLAQSKNEELEGVYRDLIRRGTPKERNRLSGSSRSTVGSAAPSGKWESSAERSNSASQDLDGLVSPLSSPDRSGQSTPAKSNGVTTPTTSHPDDTVAIAKLDADLLAARRKSAAEAAAAALQKLERSIKRDLGARTSYSKYVASAGLQDGLFAVCKAYALFDEGVGYAQGMNFIIMPLLFHMPEEEAFCLLVRLMNQYGVREMFIKDMPGLHLHLYQFERLLEDLEPALFCHLQRRGVTPQLYATQWFLTLFAYRFPLQLVLRIYDLVLSEGLEGAILKFGLVLLQKNAETLMGMKDMVALTTFLKERLFDYYIDQAPSASSILESSFFGSSGGSEKEVYRADMLVQDACAVPITAEQLRSYAAEWAEKVRLEKEREGVLETLRTTQMQLAYKVRSLENAAEKSDTEQVTLASELVRTKVANEELSDENECLKAQAAGLRREVERQPAEVESRLQEEMARIMKRNMEVQNENRALEESISDMEKDLVKAKMQFAEISSSYETLKQRWNDLRRVLGE